MIRVKQRTTGLYTFTATAEDEAGTPLDVDGLVAVHAYDGAGTQIAVDVPTIEDGKLIWTCEADVLPHLDTYRIVWSATVDGEDYEWATDVEIVGGYLFEVAALRAMDRAFTDATKYPSDVIRQIRTAVEETIEAEDAAAVAFVPRGARATLDGTGSPVVRVPHLEVRELYAVTVNGEALDEVALAAIVIDDDRLVLPTGSWWPTGIRNVTVHYAHGHARAPEPIVRAAKILAREYLVTSPLPGRATASQIGDQLFRLTIAGRDGVTGLPDVDAAIKAHGRTRYRVG